MANEGNRVTSDRGIACLSGIGANLVAYAVWRCLPSANSESAIAMIVGFTYIVLVCLWLGKRQKSLGRNNFGALTGGLVGSAYILFGHEASFGGAFQMLQLFILNPGIFSGLIALIVGGVSPLTAKGVAVRFSKGLFAGVVLGAIHLGILLLLVFGAMYFRNSLSWFAEIPFLFGGLSLACASIVYFPLMSWATGVGPAGWISKLTIWRVGTVAAVLMFIAGIFFSNSITSR